MPRCARLRLGRRVMSRPNSATEPRSGASSPVMRLNNVVLPAPFGPMMRRRSPGSTLRLTSVGDPQAPERFAQIVDDERAHGCAPPRLRLLPPSAAPGRTGRAARAPGTRPSGMKITMATKIAPSMKFQRVDIGAHHVLDDDDERRTDHRTEQRPGAARDHHQQAFRRCGQRQRLRPDELVVIDEQNSGDGGQKAGKHEGAEPDHPDMVAERIHAARLVAGAAQSRAERRAHENRRQDKRDQKDDKRGAVEAASPRRAKIRTAPAASSR